MLSLRLKSAIVLGFQRSSLFRFEYAALKNKKAESGRFIYTHVLISIRGRIESMELSSPTSASIKSEEQQQYFYDEIKAKITKIEDYKRKSYMLYIIAFISLALLAFISALPTFIYQSIYTPLLALIFILSLYTALYFNTKVKSGRSAPLENEYIFYRLKNIKKYLSVRDSKKVENELKSLIFYVNDIKGYYPDEPFTDRIFKNLCTFEEKLRTSLYPSLKHSDDKIAKNTEIYLNNALKSAMKGDLDALCDIDTASFASEKISLDDLYEPGRGKRIYEGIKGVYSIPEVRYFVTFSIVILIILVLDFFILKERIWERTKGDFIMAALASAAIVAGLESFRQKGRST